MLPSTIQNAEIVEPAGVGRTTTNSRITKATNVNPWTAPSLKCSVAGVLVCSSAVIVGQPSLLRCRHQGTGRRFRDEHRAALTRKASWSEFASPIVQLRVPRQQLHR